MSYLIPQDAVRDEQVIKKSRFITHIQHTPSKAAAQDFIAHIKSQYPDARHHCWAYIAGHPTATTAIGFSDDGEPSGTAGKPILNVLQHRGVGEITLVVVRYFGGIKLGAGGLVRAYSSSASLAMDKLNTRLLIPQQTLSLCFNYAQENNIKYLLERFDASIIRADYGEQVTLDIQVAAQDVDACTRQLVHATSGNVILRKC